MKKAVKLLMAAAVLAAVVWALSSLSTGMVRMLAFVDGISSAQEAPAAGSTAAPGFELTDQDYDVLDIPADAPEHTRAPGWLDTDQQGEPLS